MSLKEIKLSEVEELVMEVDHLAIQLSQIVHKLPQNERIISRLEKASESFELSVKLGLNKLEKALLDLDYSKIQKDLAEVVRHQVVTIIHSMEKVQKYHKDLETAQGKTHTSINMTKALIDSIEEKIETLTDQLSVIPAFDRRLAIGTGLAGFFSGIAVIYLLSFITWLPKPYFATNEQAILLEMVKNHTLRLDSSALDSIKVSVDYDTFNTHNSNTGDNK